jgi:TPR repeat protein
MARFARRHNADDLSEVEPLMARIWRRTSLVQPLLALSRYAYARGDMDEALRYARRAADASPQFASAAFGYIGLLTVLGRDGEATRALERLLASQRELSAATANEAREDYRRARASVADCAPTDVAACETLAKAYRQGRFAPYDPARAGPLFVLACEHGRWTACLPAANALRLGEGFAPNPARGAALLRRACDHSEWSACNDLGDQHEKGIGVARDFGRAVALYRLACDHDEAWGCVSLASLAWRGLGLPHDETQIVEWLRRAARTFKPLATRLAEACEDDSEACGIASVTWANGLGVTTDAERARELMELGCARGETPACQAR